MQYVRKDLTKVENANRKKSKMQFIASKVSFCFAQVWWQRKDLLIKAGICRVTALLPLAQASKVLSEHFSFPIHSKVWMRGPQPSRACFGKVTKIAGKGRKWSQCMEGFPICFQFPEVIENPLCLATSLRQVMINLATKMLGVVS